MVRAGRFDAEIGDEAMLSGGVSPQQLQVRKLCHEMDFRSRDVLENDEGYPRWGERRDLI